MLPKIGVLENEYVFFFIVENIQIPLRIYTLKTEYALTFFIFTTLNNFYEILFYFGLILTSSTT